MVAMNTFARSSFLYMNVVLQRDLSAPGKTKTALCLATFFAVSSFVSAACAYEPFGTVELSSGGPYIGTGLGLQRFKAALPAGADRTRPTYITIFNGGGGRVGYSFARVILTNQLLQGYG